MELTENRISEDSSIEFTQSEQGKQTEKNKQSFRDLQQNNKKSNIHIMGVLEAFEVIMAESVSNLIEDINAQNQQAM